MFRFLIIVMAYSLSFLSKANLVSTLEKIKPSVVGVGIYTPLGRPQNSIKGTGFIIGNGLYVITNHHVISDELDTKLKQQLAVFIGSGKNATVRHASLIDYSKKYDLAILQIEGSKLPSMVLAAQAYIKEGSDIAFTGFPIGSVLGLYPVTHRGIISSITPTVTPVVDSRNMNLAMLRRLKDPYLAYQLDATAYPGNSGSALYEIETGKVVGVINKVFVQKTKENVMSHPSGITYAIPVKHVIELLEKNKIPFK